MRLFQCEQTIVFVTSYLIINLWSLTVISLSPSYMYFTLFMCTRLGLILAVSALWACLNHGNCVLATQDFRHAVQGNSENVADFLRQLETLFQFAYGWNRLRT